MFFEKNIFKRTKRNPYFRQEISTHDFSQLVLMSVEPGDEIGEESHDVDQVLIFTEGRAKAIIGDETFKLQKGALVIVPAGVVHNFINIGSKPLKLFTVYTPPEEPVGTLHRTKAEADAAEHH
ncbi:cupin domain-containing protein [Parvularcula sp. LCG005]|uniref:cupin domain-containing protein n=1 Tax=Parvularcula sp. LCG005 TaxID=3078805 RepID=UPI002941FDC5|nr:cupin domain-containing protein [Parvularcula sp. LCG005]WOI52775.1 cupin domain-containing protein [Parvularcula sp. LCG005]